MELLTADQYLPSLSDSIDYSKYGIGLVGCGTIANQAHLPAYQKMGLKVVACCDVNEEAARATAKKFNIPFWTTDVRQLIALEEVKIFDLAVHPEVRKAILQEIAKAPRPVLCQKPLALDITQAQNLGRLAADNNIVLGINQQARWAPEHRALKILLDQGIIGDLYSIHHYMRSFQDQAGWWWTKMHNFNIVDHGIHYVDLCRHFSNSSANEQNEWTRVQCTTAMLPEQNSVDPLIYSANIEFGPIGGRNNLMANLHFNNIAKGYRSHEYIWWIDGTEGSIGATHDKIILSKAEQPSSLLEIKLKGSWFPDGFAGSMLDFIARIDQGEKPAVTPQDNYKTIALTTAMVMSSKEGRVVERQEVLTPDVCIQT